MEFLNGVQYFNDIHREGHSVQSGETLCQAFDQTQWLILFRIKGINQAAHIIYYSHTDTGFLRPIQIPESVKNLMVHQPIGNQTFLTRISKISF